MFKLFKLCRFSLLVPVFVLQLSTAIAQEFDTNSFNSSNESVDSLVTKITSLTYKDALLKQELINVPLAMDRFEKITQRGYTLSFTDTGAVIQPIGSAVMCVMDGRYVIKESRYDEDNDVLLVDLRLDDHHPNIICSGFSDNVETTRCSVRHNEIATEIVGDPLSFFRDNCLDQMRFLTMDNSGQT